MKLFITTILCAMLYFTQSNTALSQDNPLINNNIIMYAMHMCKKDGLVLIPESIMPGFAWGCVQEKTIEPVADGRHEYLSPIFKDEDFEKTCKRLGAILAIINREDNILVCSTE